MKIISQNVYTDYFDVNRSNMRTMRTADIIPTRETEISRGEAFRISPDRSRGPPCLLHNGYALAFPAVRRSGRGVDRPPPTSAEVKERVELYVHSPSGLSRRVLG